MPLAAALQRHETCRREPRNADRKSARPPVLVLRALLRAHGALDDAAADVPDRLRRKSSRRVADDAPALVLTEYELGQDPACEMGGADAVARETGAGEQIVAAFQPHDERQPMQRAVDRAPPGCRDRDAGELREQLPHTCLDDVRVRRRAVEARADV